MWWDLDHTVCQGPGQGPGTGPAHSPLPAWKIPPLAVYMGHSFTAFRFLLKCLPYQSPSLTMLHKVTTLPLPATFLSFLTFQSTHLTYLLAYLCFVLLFPLDYKPRVGKFLVHLTHCFISEVWQSARLNKYALNG